MTARELYDRCLGMGWDDVRRELAGLDTLTAAGARAAYEALGFRSRWPGRAKALGMVRLAVLDRKGAAERVEC